MTETPFYFTNRSYSLFGLLHEPEVATGSAGFVFCHPFGEEKLWSHRVYVTFARALAAKGHPVLRFDYMGNGDSDGAFRESSLATAIDDVHAAVRELRRRTNAPAVSLLGLRLGGTIASLAAEDTADLDSLVLWSPIVDGARYMQELLRINLTTQLAVYREIQRDREELVAALRAGETVNVDGYEMALPMYDQVSAVKLAEASKRCQGRCLIAQIDRQPGRLAPELTTLSEQYANATVVFAQEEPFWKEIARFYEQAPSLFNETHRWLNQSPAIDHVEPTA